VDARTDTITANGLEFAFLEMGDGPLALCLHGFPDSAHTWRHLMPVLADSGYRAVAPFMRGYAPTEVPADGRYSIGALGADAVALHEALGGEADAVIIGHDWGAMATYAAAAHAADRWRRVVGIAVPPLGAVADLFFRYEQLKRSFYIFFFQTPLADLVVPMNDLAFIAGLWADWSPGYDATTDLEHVRAALGTPEHLGAAIGYYRTMLGTIPNDGHYAAFDAAAAQVAPQPLLYLHGDRDGALGIDLARNAKPLLTGESRMEEVAGTGHFLHLEKPDAVNSLILEFLQK
jgi:pimeloyl-ACP methyl ester carboxylesterase